MELGLFTAYAATVIVLALTPGPSTMLGSAHGMRYGARGTVPTILGDLSANSLQMLAAALGLGAVVASSRSMFLALKWAGVAYLVWLALDHLRKARRAETLSAASSPGNHRRFLQGFITSASNPKAVVFFAALFPQFIDPNGSLVGQLLILGTTFLVIDGASVMLYAATGGRLSRWLAAKGRVGLQRRITGWFLLIAAGLLSLRGAPAGAD